MGAGALLSALTPAGAMAAAGKGRPPGEIRQGRHRHPQLRPHPRVPRGRLLQRGDAKNKVVPRAPQESAFLKATTADENAHVAFLKKALGSKAVAAPKVDFGDATSKAKWLPQTVDGRSRTPGSRPTAARR